MQPHRSSALGPPILCLALALSGCGRTYAPRELTATPENLAEASAVLEDAAQRRPDVRMSEGAIVVDAWSYEWREQNLDRDLDRTFPAYRNLPEEAVVRRRTRGPARPVRVTAENLRAVRVHDFAFGAALELELSDQSEPVFLDAADAAEAESLGAAFGLLLPPRPPEVPAAP